MPAIREVENAAVLQKPSDDTADTNVIADPTNSRSQRACSTDDEIYLHSRLRRAVQRRNEVLIEKRIHFRNDARRATKPRVIALAGDQIKAVLRNVYRRNHQRCVTGVLRIGGE